MDVSVASHHTQAGSCKLSSSSKRLYLLYHELRTVPSTYSYAIEKSEFERHADLFLQLRNSGSVVMWPEITFDDGHLSNYELALPVLASRELRATFFITVGWTGKRDGYMGWDQVRGLQENGQRIGAHGWTHTLLTHCDDAALRTELDTARLTLEDKLGIPVTSMSLPGGRFDRRVLTACRQAGYTQVYSSVPRAEEMPTAALIGRLNIRNGQPVEWLAQLLNPHSDVLTRLERQEKWKSALKATLGDGIYAKLWAVLNRQEKDTGANEVPGR